ncbi:MAG: acyloxyacyl hydrolase [Candidatus Limimorpha sp.]
MKIIKKPFYLILLSVSIIIGGKNHALANDNDTIAKANLQIEMRLAYGFNVCHHSEMYRFRAHYPLFELGIQHDTYGNKLWQQPINYPSVGLTLLYSGLGSIKEIGSVVALYPYLKFYFNKGCKNRVALKMGVGIGYLTNKFDPVTNYANTFVGSHFNAALNIALEYKRMITERFSLSLNAGLTHFSNGSMRTPNNGLNIINAGLSACYFIDQPQHFIRREPSDNKAFRSWDKENISYYLSFTYAFKDTDEYMGYGKTWSVYCLHANVLKRISRLSKLGIGFDISYDETDKAVLFKDNIAFHDFEILKPGINVAYELMMGSTSILLNAGCHLFAKEDSEGLLYQKIFLKQNLGKNTFITCGLTTHFGWADNFSFGIGYRIN